MSPVRPHEADLDGILHAIRLGPATQACEADPVVDALRAVLVPDVEHNGLFSEVEEQPRSSRVPSVPASFPIRMLRAKEAKREDLLGGHIAHEQLRTPPPPPPRRRVHLRDRGHAWAVACHRADGRDVAARVVDPHKPLRDELAGLDPGAFDGEGEVDLMRDRELSARNARVVPG